MAATATPRGISLAVGELGARGRPTFYKTSRTAVSVNWIRSLRPSTVFVDVCPRDTHTPHGLSCFCRTGISLSLEHPGRSCHIHTARAGCAQGCSSAAQGHAVARRGGRPDGQRFRHGSGRGFAVRGRRGGRGG